MANFNHTVTKKNGSAFQYKLVSKPVTPEMHSLCDKVELSHCSCGGEPRFILQSHDKPACAVHCTNCKSRTRIHLSPEEAGYSWNTANSNKKSTCALSVSAAQPTRLYLLQSAINKYKGKLIPRCGCGGDVSLVISYAHKPYSICSCNDCGYETELQENEDLAIGAWIGKSQ